MEDEVSITDEKLVTMNYYSEQQYNDCRAQSLLLGFLIGVVFTFIFIMMATGVL